ncbi:MAG TPA: hypothetical protein VFS30_10535 [Dehalococcoidia bacterium]|nr:hypothetical protein [Dehalococcoidia bacterium]
MEHRLAAIAKGYALMRAAHLDFAPALGRNSTARQPSPLDGVRGSQWRLVAAVAGFEIFLRGRIGREEKIWKLVEAALPMVSLAPPAPIARRRRSAAPQPRTLERWLDFPAASQKSRLADFLGLNKFEEPLLVNWLRGTSAVTEWVEHVAFATALRNVTAHGALSAKKVRDLRLRRPFDVLPTHLFEFAAASLEPAVAALAGGVSPPGKLASRRRKVRR